MVRVLALVKTLVETQAGIIVADNTVDFTIQTRFTTIIERSGVRMDAVADFEHTMKIRQARSCEQKRTLYGNKLAIVKNMMHLSTIVEKGKSLCKLAECVVFCAH